MPLKLMYITNNPEVAAIAEKAGVDRIFVDMEYIGKAKRQGGMDTVQNHHTIEDIRTIRKVVKKADLLVRVNPIHDATDEYCSSEDEIRDSIKAGADIMMLPFFKTTQEVERFVKCINGSTRTMLLLETPEAVENLDNILKIPGIDEIHIGINDLSLGYGKKFMFELLADGTVEKICFKLKQAGIPYGFGGVAAIGTGQLPAEVILGEHYRLGSSMVILSRSFCDLKKETDLKRVRQIFGIGIEAIRSFEKNISTQEFDFKKNQKELRRCVEIIEKEILGKD